MREQTVVRLAAGHLDPIVVAQLVRETGSAAPVVEANYFRFRVLNSIKDDGPFKVIWGGLYYQFLGLQNLKEQFKAKTDFDGLVKAVGADEPTAEQRAGLRRSRVTGKPRAIGFFPAKSRGILDGRAALVVTEDPKDKSIDHTQHALKTLDRRFLRFDAREVIWTQRNGLLGYSLYDAQGALQDEAPPDVVADTTIPAPHGKRLQSASSCIRCHEATGDDGWKPAANDVLSLLRGGLDVFGDAKDPNRAVVDTIKALSGQYKSDPARFLKDARNDLQASTLEATGPWEGSAAPTAVVKLAALQYQADTLAYWYGEVTPEVALRELGYEAVPREGAAQFLKRLLQPDPADNFFGVFIPETVTVGSLRLGQPVSRAEWSLDYAFAQFRATRELGRMIREQAPPPRVKQP